MPPKRCVHVLRLSLWNANSESTTWRFRCCKEYPRRIKGSARYANRFDFDTSSKSNVRQGCVSSSHTDSAGDGGSLAGTARCAACASPPVGAAASEVMRAAETAGRQGGRCAGWHWRLSERRRRGNGRLDRAARVCVSASLRFEKRRKRWKQGKLLARRGPAGAPGTRRQLHTLYRRDRPASILATPPPPPCASSPRSCCWRLSPSMPTSPQRGPPARRPPARPLPPGPPLGASPCLSFFLRTCAQRFLVPFSRPRTRTRNGGCEP
jgi:hypothetical protein